MLDLVNDSALEAPHFNMLESEAAMDSGLAVSSAYIAIALGCVSSLICFLTLVAILHTRRPMAPNLQFVFSLLCSDLLTSTSVISKLSYEVGRLTEPSPCATIFMDCLRMTAHIAAFFNLCLIAVDMHVGILHPLRYATFIDTRRVRILISISWLLAFLLGFSVLYVPSTTYDSSEEVNEVRGNTSYSITTNSSFTTQFEIATSVNVTQNETFFGKTPFRRRVETFKFEEFCNLVFAKEYDSLFAALAVLVLSAIIMSSIYVRIFCTIKRIHKTDDRTAKTYGSKPAKEAKQNWSTRLFLRSKYNNHNQHENQQPHQQNQPLQHLNSISFRNPSPESNKNRRGLVTTLIILAVFCVCFLPYFLADAASATIIFFCRTVWKIPIYELNGPAADYLAMIPFYTFFLYDILMLNSILDPVIYAIRMREVRIGYRKLFRICGRTPFGRQRMTGLTSSRFGTGEGIAFDLPARKGLAVSDIASRNGRSTCSFLSHQSDASHETCAAAGAAPGSTHDRVDVHSVGIDHNNDLEPHQDQANPLMYTSVISNKTSATILENNATLHDPFKASLPDCTENCKLDN